MRNFIFLLLFSFIIQSISAQNLTVKGIVKDAGSNITLPSASIIVKNNENEYGKVTDKEGYFIFENIKAGTYSIQISFIGYKKFTAIINQQSGIADLGIIKLEPEITKLDEVVVEGKAPISVMNKDTVQFNADAFKTNPDANAEDLIKKMPGVVVQDGKVQSQGEDIKKVLVDGKPFFDQDPSLALKSLPADVVEKVQIFDEQSEQSRFSGFDDGNTTKTLNIVTRNRSNSGQFGKINAGYGYPDKYAVSGNVNIFKNNRRISLIGQSNNINQQNFSTEDILGVIGTSGRMGGGGMGFRGGQGRMGGGGFGGFNQMFDFMVGQQAGISKTHALGLNYSDKIGSKITFTASYFFNQSNNHTDQNSSQDFFSTFNNKNRTYDESYISDSKNGNHRFSLRFEYNIDSANRILIMPRFSIQNNKSSSNSTGTTFLDSELLNKTENIRVSNSLGYNFSNTILYMHRFAKRGRTISFQLNNSVNNRENDRNQNSYNTYNNDSIFTYDTINQYSSSLTNTSSIGSAVEYTEPITEKSQISINYRNSFEWNNSDKGTYNFNSVSQQYDIIDSILSNKFKNFYYTNQIGTGYRYRNNKISFNFNVNYQRSDMINNPIFPEREGKSYTFQSILPVFRFNYEFQRSENLNINYRANTRNPSIDQLQDVVNNSNPLRLSTGNPDLKESYQHSINIRYSKANISRSNVLMIFGMINLTQDYIANSTFIAEKDTFLLGRIQLQKGSQLTIPVNLDGYWNARVFTTYGFPVKPIKCNLNFNISYNFSHIPNYYNWKHNYSDNHVAGFGLTIASNISENLDFSLSSNSNYNYAVNSLASQSDNKYFTQFADFSLNWQTWQKIVFQTKFTYQQYKSITQDYTQEYFLLNAGIGKKFLKDNSLTIKLMIYDILNQNNAISHNVTDTYVEDSKTNALGRYYMFTLTYNLKRFGTANTNNTEIKNNQRNINLP
jgi:hypothetical protein